ncbi:hypothetical protein EVAR_23488_1 [Eumeta japonica]|uniref:Uncharacterized protein n=1 Tax=Eumeta variegata TaxID=151549 RepID=A0A4C1UL78_EUMVA|nr:hypothetical protein EVAR_23488_1 [Eumeta japonica]
MSVPSIKDDNELLWTPLKGLAFLIEYATVEKTEYLNVSLSKWRLYGTRSAVFSPRRFFLFPRYRKRISAQGLCCLNGKAKLPELLAPPKPLESLLSGQGTQSKHFQKIFKESRPVTVLKIRRDKNREPRAETKLSLEPG